MTDEIKRDPKQWAFFEQVFDFVMTCCSEFPRERTVEFDWLNPSAPTAKVVLEFFSGSRYEVPIVVGNDGDAVIDTGDAGVMKLNGHGLYAYPFHEADASRRRLEDRLK